MSKHIRVRRTGPVAEITLNRPEKLNAITPEMAADLQRACIRLDADDAVRVVIVRGAGE